MEHLVKRINPGSYYSGMFGWKGVIRNKRGVLTAWQRGNSGKLKDPG